MTETVIEGGCLCGQLRYRVTEAPIYGGYCFCADCRRASGSGFMPFIGVIGTTFEVVGAARQFISPALRGEAVRNFCPACGSIVFGGRLGIDEQHTVYAGSLDDPTLFRPTIAIFNDSRPAWAPLPDGLKVFARMPG